MIDVAVDTNVFVASFIEKDRLSDNSRCKQLVDESCLCGIKCLGITNDTNKRIVRMLKWNKFVSFVHS